MPGGGTGAPVWALTESSTVPSQGLRSRGPQTARATLAARHSRAGSRGRPGRVEGEHEALAETHVVGGVGWSIRCRARVARCRASARRRSRSSRRRRRTDHPARPPLRPRVRAAGRRPSSIAGLRGREVEQLRSGAASPVDEVRVLVPPGAPPHMAWRPWRRSCSGCPDSTLLVIILGQVMNYVAEYPNRQGCKTRPTTRPAGVSRLRPRAARSCSRREAVRGPGWRRRWQRSPRRPGCRSRRSTWRSRPRAVLRALELLLRGDQEDTPVGEAVPGVLRSRTRRAWCGWPRNSRMVKERAGL